MHSLRSATSRLKDFSPNFSEKISWSMSTTSSRPCCSRRRKVSRSVRLVRRCWPSTMNGSAALLRNDDGAEVVAGILRDVLAGVVGLVEVEELRRQVSDQFGDLLGLPLVLALVVVDGVLVAFQNVADRPRHPVNLLHTRPGVPDSPLASTGFLCRAYGGDRLHSFRAADISEPSLPEGEGGPDLLGPEPVSFPAAESEPNIARRRWHHGQAAERDEMETWDAIVPGECAPVQTRAGVGRRPEPDRRGRMAGPSAKNRQAWDFVIVTDKAQLQELSTVWQGAGHIAGAAAAIAFVIAGPPE